MAAREHAVVVGGSIAGLCAAAVALRHFDRVTLIERDELRDDAAVRKGVGQGNQIHALLPLGMEKIERLFPGFEGELREAGAHPYCYTSEVAIFSSQGWRTPLTTGVDFFGFRRPMFEQVIRRHLLAADRLEIVQGSVSGLEFDDRRRVIGVQVRDADGPTLADLVIDASGRGSQTPKWLREAGLEAPREVTVKAYLGYATQDVELPEGVLPEGVAGVSSMPYPGNTRGGVLLPSDNGIYTLCAVGMNRDYPTSDPEEFLDFLDGASSPLLGEVARKCTPASEIRTYHMPGNQMRMWSEMETPVRGLVAIGDAVASFNPSYGQGMTVAACAAVNLDEILADPGAEEIEGRFQRAAAEATEAAFAIAAGGDAGWDGVELDGFPAPTPEAGEFGARLEQLATEDPEIILAFIQAGYYLDPAALATPEVVEKVDRWAAEGRVVENKDPDVWPRLSKVRI
jgi:2-polyprenyl-6-methoxyphenol hydroxylase-like FAD-dependent oxidoreductase